MTREEVEKLVWDIQTHCWEKTKQWFKARYTLEICSWPNVMIIINPENFHITISYIKDKENIPDYIVSRANYDYTEVILLVTDIPSGTIPDNYLQEHMIYRGINYLM